jgi:hypothetical protein
MLVLLILGFVKYAVEMDSDAMVYAPSFIKTGSASQKIIGMLRI